MTNDPWVEAASTNAAMVAELLLRIKHSSSSDSLNAPPPSTSVTQNKAFKLPYWGHRKNRSKSTATVSNGTHGIGKEQRRSPTTHLSWSGGGGSTSDGYDESSRPSDLSSGGRSVKANEGASTFSHDRSLKRKEMVSMHVTLNQEMATSENMKRIKIDFDRRNEIGSTVDDERMMTGQPCRVEAKRERGFVVPDLNMMPTEEEAAAAMTV